MKLNIYFQLEVLYIGAQNLMWRELRKNNHGKNPLMRFCKLIKIFGNRWQSVKKSIVKKNE